MMEYKNELGQTISDEQLDKMLDEIENGDFSKFEDVSDCVYGHIAGISQEKVTVSFTLPTSAADELSNLAKKQSCTRSDVLRSFVFDGLLRTSV